MYIPKRHILNLRTWRYQGREFDRCWQLTSVEIWRADGHNVSFFKKIVTVHRQ